jgi:hypothetical protein
MRYKQSGKYNQWKIAIIPVAIATQEYGALHYTAQRRRDYIGRSRKITMQTKTSMTAKH